MPPLSYIGNLFYHAVFLFVKGNWAFSGEFSPVFLYSGSVSAGSALFLPRFRPAKGYPLTAQKPKGQSIPQVGSLRRSDHGLLLVARRGTAKRSADCLLFQTAPLGEAACIVCGKRAPYKAPSFRNSISSIHKTVPHRCALKSSVCEIPSIRSL